jgi:hypothetical protein
MPALQKKIKEWIDDIPDNKLDGAFGHRSIYKDRDYRLDNQGETTHEPRMFNLQVQVNRGCKGTTLARLAPYMVAFCLAPIDGSWTPKQIKDALKATVTGGKVMPGV